ncbi:MAG: hypothetical protein ACR2QG_10500 [Gammaproteobacteria bacterium]
MNKNLFQIGAFALPALIMISFFLSFIMYANQMESGISIRPDSGNYILFAEQIISGEVFEKKPVEEIKFGRAIRTPGYPLLIAAFTFGDPEANIDNVLLAHLLIALCTLLFVSYQLRNLCPPLLTGLAVMVAQAQMSKPFGSVMTEFVAFNILLILLALTVKAIQKPDNGILFWIGLIGVIGVLVRPAMVVCLPIVPLLVLYRRRLSIRDSLILASALIPLTMWMGFNKYQLGAFTITQVSGLNAMGIGSQLGHAEVLPGDPPELVAFIEDMHTKKQPPKGKEDEHIANLNPDYKFLLLKNTYWISMETRAAVGTIPFDRDYLWHYGTRSINANLDNYARYVVYGLTLFFSFVFPGAAILMLIVPAYGILRKRALTLSYTAIVMFLVHSGSALLTSAYEAVWDRYVILTFYPFAVSIALCAFSLILTSQPVSKRLEQSAEKDGLLARVLLTN